MSIKDNENNTFSDRNFVSWESYRAAYKEGGVVLSCKSVANIAFRASTQDQPFFQFFYSALLFVSMFLIVPVTFVSYFFSDFSFLYVVGSFFVSSFLIAVCRTAHVQAMNDRAFENKEFFIKVNRAGGFRDPRREFYQDVAS